MIITYIQLLDGATLVIENTIGVIGIGKIGESMISGFVSSKVIDNSNLFATDIRIERRQEISKKYNIKCYSSNSELANKADIIIISVKPTDVKKVLHDISGIVSSSNLIITIAAGVAINYFEKHLPNGVPIIRAMPNIAVLTREGMTAMAAGPNVTSDHIETASEIFKAVGKIVLIEEKYLDAVTGLSGSGPAYVYVVIEALTEAGVKVGLAREVASLLAAQTALGAASVVLKTQEHPARLKDMVTTPGGTTIEGLLQLEEGKIRMAFINAVIKATEKAKDLVVNG
jgi:pyrroline-5-carboxylate reductase